MPASNSHAQIEYLICGVDGLRHARIKSSWTNFQAYTTPKGEQRLDEIHLVLGNCTTCGSTIAIEASMRDQHFQNLDKMSRFTGEHVVCPEDQT